MTGAPSRRFLVLILSAATTILVTRSSAESTGVSYTKDFMCPQKKKSSGLRSGEQGSQATGPPRPIHRAGYVVFKKCRIYLFIQRKHTTEMTPFTERMIKNIAKTQATK
ncbi:hypothetical protein AVEN_196920-1 [Araneus ventricosus]|uniref:Secreted protein n=1 Tax=Araneus ventricosus TaxID=182803 RepID=A0A4Y2R0S5_ARAVE|nr:hypothetical protein AVEN_196920-1 [Araneus ventricosus]